MGRLLILALLVLLLAWWLFGRIGQARKTSAAAPRSNSKGPQEMVVCAHCGLHLPQAEAVKDGALHYCGEGHRLAGPRT